MKKVIWFTFVVLSTLSVLLLFWQFSLSIVLFVLSLAVAAAIRPSIANLTLRGLSRTTALAVVYSLVTGFMLLLITAISPPIFQDLQKIADDLIAGYEKIIVQWPREGTAFQKAIAEQLPPPSEFYNAITSEEGIAALSGIFGLAQNLFTILGRIGLILILSLYWSADQLHFERLTLSLFPIEYHAKVRKVWRSVETGVGAYVRSEFIQSVLAGIILGVGYWVLGVRYAAILALWVAVARLIPWFGAMIAVLPPLIVGIASSPGLAIWVSVYTIGVLLLMKLFIEPRFFPRHQYNSLLIVLFVIALAEMFGVLGVLLAPPLAVTTQILFEQLAPSPPKIYSQAVIEKSEQLKVRVEKLKERVHRSEEVLPQQTAQQVEQFRKLTQQVADYLQEY